MIGGASNAWMFIKFIPIVIAFILVIVALVYMPGTVTNKTKYVKQDDHDHVLGTSDLGPTITSLTFVMICLLISFGLNFKVVKEYMKGDQLISN